eukprot:TRINITY_DN9557_c0_g1_i1.p3 TRINITY_DN9557_c0_g1~~TRINITY_DN9557_c0_g1_i1.p3  ORF type:complete len:121 (+),score=8.36 TRINITY_DN9557_c0_g1_i1:91-453(+)
MPSEVSSFTATSATSARKRPMGQGPASKNNAAELPSESFCSCQTSTTTVDKIKVRCAVGNTHARPSSAGCTMSGPPSPPQTLEVRIKEERAAREQAQKELSATARELDLMEKLLAQQRGS